MFNFFNKSIIKGYKVCKNNERERKFGIAAESYESLLKKIEEKFKIKNFELFFDNVVISDETYFRTVPAQSLIVIVEENDEYKTETDVIMSIFHKIYQDTFMSRDLIKNFLKSDQNEELIKKLLACQSDLDEKTKASDRESHAEWFNKNDSKKATKEEVMRSKARDRIKGYFYKTKDELTKSRIYQTNLKARNIIDELLNDFFIYLSGNNFFECLFDRSHETKYIVKKAVNDETDSKAFKVKRRKVDEETKLKLKRINVFEKWLVSLCDNLGIFDCHGTWDSNSCNYEHKINPYASRESLILFQIFNLDHQVEISRSIFPSIIKNIERLCTEKELKCEEHQKELVNLSTITYFLEIFTVKNLKLVHIICHDKGSHLLDTKGRLLCEDCSELKLIKKIKLKLS